MSFYSQLLELLNNKELLACIILKSASKICDSVMVIAHNLFIMNGTKAC